MTAARDSKTNILLILLIYPDLEDELLEVGEEAEDGHRDEFIRRTLSSPVGYPDFEV